MSRTDQKFYYTLSNYITILRSQKFNEILFRCIFRAIDPFCVSDRFEDLAGFKRILLTQIVTYQRLLLIIEMPWTAITQDD